MTFVTDSTIEPSEMIEPVATAARPRAKFRKRGVVTKWLAIIWLALLTFTAIGANWVPWVNHDCSQFGDKAATECSTHLIGSPFLLEKPPAWATFADAKGITIPGAPERTGWFGTDSNGRDIFARSMFGARVSLTIGASSIIFGLIIGGGLGLLAGYKGGRIDRFIEALMNIILAFPALLLVVFIVGFFGSSGADQATNRSIQPIILALVVLSIPPLQKLVRANTIVYAQREFVTAARSIGASSSRIVLREILPNVVPAMLTFALVGVAIVIVAEGALAYLGLSVNAPSPTWGNLILDGQSKLENSWWISLMPAATMFVTILSINLLGDVLAEKFRIREAIG
ncbi:MAG: ABC transporter permease [Ilumatobacteraceae bacterium]